MVSALNLAEQSVPKIIPSSGAVRLNHLERVRRFGLSCLPPSAVQYVRDRKVEWRDRAAVRAFAAVTAAEPIVFYSVGARGGLDSTEAYFRRRGKMKLVAFEPEPVEAGRLAAEGSLDFVMPYALGNEAGQRTLNIARQPGYSSLREPHEENVRQLAPAPEKFQVERRIPIEVLRLDEAVSRHGLPPPDVLEIDVQGYEFEILQGCGELLQGISSLSLELHFQPLYRGEKTFAEVLDWLWAQGFILSLLRRASVWRNLIEVDACFYNRELFAKSPRCAATLGYWQSRYDARRRKRI